MKLPFIVLIIVYLNNIVLATEKDELRPWNCTEVGPILEDDADFDYEKYRSKDRVVVSHMLTDKNIEMLKNHTIFTLLEGKERDHYQVDDIQAIVDDIRGDKYLGYPVHCKKKGEEDIKFFDHPYVLKSHELNKDSIKSTTGSHLMKCEIFRPENHLDQTNFTWKWFRKGSEDNTWKSLESEYTNENFVFKTFYKNYTNETTNTTVAINIYSQLEIKSLSKNHEAEYRCTADNKYGFHEYTFDLKVLSLFSLVMPFIIGLIFVLAISVGVLSFEKIQAKKQSNTIKA